MKLSEFNQLSAQRKHDTLQQCCASDRWIKLMIQSVPFANKAHPKIGDVSSLREKYSNTKAIAGHEQSGANNADERTIQLLAEGNAKYENKFGYIFIVCATGKSAAEMLQILNARLPNNAQQELPMAAEEQRKITQLRLEKLFV